MTYKSSVYLSKYVVSNYCTNGLFLFNWKKRVKFFCFGLHVLLVKMKTSALLLQSSLRSLVTTKGKKVHFWALWTFCVRKFVPKKKRKKRRKWTNIEESCGLYWSEKYLNNLSNDYIEIVGQPVACFWKLYGIFWSHAEWNVQIRDHFFTN